jgi:leucyl-tRNA synthetase
MPVDTYTGGIEHATMHLIYTRYFHKAFRDMGVMEGHEPMLQLRNQGIVLGEDSEKMSKSRGNVVAPDALVDKYGADTVRAYLTFFSRWDQGGPWDSQGIEGTARWLRRVWVAFTGSVQSKPDDEAAIYIRRKLHQTLKKVTQDYETFEFNTIISSLMELMNEIYKVREGIFATAIWDEVVSVYLRMMAPVTPHIAEELWIANGHPYSIHHQPWPEVDEEAAKDEEIELIIQINGKLKDKIRVDVNISDAEAEKAALASPEIQKALNGNKPRKIIVVTGRLVNIVM